MIFIAQLQVRALHAAFHDSENELRRQRRDLNKTKHPRTHWHANSDAGVTFHLLNTMVTYCTKRIDEVPVTGCQVYNGFRLVVPTACLLPTTSDSAIAADVVGVATSSLAVERTASILVGTA